MVILEYIGKFFYDAFTNAAILVPVIAWITAQVLKTVIYSVMYRKFSWHRMFGDGGMPSAHSATVSSLAIIVGDMCGFNSPIFGFAVMFAVVVMHDAVGVRRETGKQAVTILTIADVINNYLDEHDLNLKTEKLKVLVGHTPLQVVLGSVLGVVIAIIYIAVCRGALGIDLSWYPQAVC